LFAQELARTLDLPVTLDKDLQELHFGVWEGQSAVRLMQTDAEALGLFWADPYAFTPPEGEPVLEFSARVLSGGVAPAAGYAGAAGAGGVPRRGDQTVTAGPGPRLAP
jgi:alpha-ribazole phosphatase